MSQRTGSPPEHQNSVCEASKDAADTTTTSRTRRHFLAGAAATAGAVGAGFAIWPFIDSMRPGARAQALGAAVQVDIQYLEPGDQVTVTWRGQPVWVLRRTEEMLERMMHQHWTDSLRDPDSAVETQQPPYAQNVTRSLRPDIFVVVALCTHLGCVPSFRPQVSSEDLGQDWMGGYFCPCHGSRFDLAGRVAKKVPAPTNLVVPPHRFLNANMLEIGVDYV